MADSEWGAHRGLVSNLRARWETGQHGDEVDDDAFGLNRGARGGARGRSVVTQRQVEQVLLETDPEDAVEEFLAEPTGAAPERRASVLMAVTARASRQGEVRLIFKMPGKNVGQAQVMNLPELFRKEAAMYSHVLPRLAALFPDDTAALFPRALSATPERLVLHDLTADGYRAADRTEGLDLDHCTAVMSALGRFHAASLALKSHSDGVATLSDAGREVQFTEARRALYEPMFTAGTANTVDILRRHPEASRYVEAVREILEDRFDRLVKFLRPNEPTAVLTHGDLWTDNLLFAYDADTGKPSDVKFVDFQQCRYGDPALDINYFLYSSVTAKVRDDADDMIRVYHRSLTRSLKKVGAAPPFSLAELRRDVQQGAVYGLLTADLLLRVALNQFESGTDPVEVMSGNAPDDAFAKRIVEVVVDLGELGVLKP